MAIANGIANEKQDRAKYQRVGSAVTGAFPQSTAGFRGEALRLLGELNRRRQTGYVPAAAFIFAYLGLGDKDHVFVWLNQAYEEQSNALQTLNVFPLFDPIRTDPRFIDLLHRRRPLTGVARYS